jgi:hypothetical protein
MRCNWLVRFSNGYASNTKTHDVLVKLALIKPAKQQPPSTPLDINQ